MMKLTIREVAQCLNLPADTVQRWIRQGSIPLSSTGSYCTFKVSALEKWAAEHNLCFTPMTKDRAVPQPEMAGPESLFTVMQRSGIFYNIHGNNPESVLMEAINKIPGLTQSLKATIYSRLLEREALVSTGIGQGIAIPHPRSPLSGQLIQSQIVTCFLDAPIDYAAIDGKPVFMLFILLSPSTKIHLHLLSRIAYCLRDAAFVEFLKTTPAPDPFFNRIKAIEKHLEDTDTL
jgi:PTS system nitrogen regulatory IIA component